MYSGFFDIRGKIISPDYPTPLLDYLLALVSSMVISNLVCIKKEKRGPEGWFWVDDSW
jgi:hypothetical protein